MSINHVLKRHCTKHNEKPFDLAIDSITEADSFQLTALIDSLKAPCLKKTQDKLDKDIYNLGKCVLGIFQKYASETYPEEWKIEEDQEVDRTVRLGWSIRTKNISMPARKNLSENLHERITKHWERGHECDYSKIDRSVSVD